LWTSRQISKQMITKGHDQRSLGLRIRVAYDFRDSPIPYYSYFLEWVTLESDSLENTRLPLGSQSRTGSRVSVRTRPYPGSTHTQSIFDRTDQLWAQKGPKTNQDWDHSRRVLTGYRAGRRRTGDSSPCLGPSRLCFKLNATGRRISEPCRPVIWQELWEQTDLSLNQATISHGHNCANRPISCDLKCGDSDYGAPPPTCERFSSETELNGHVSESTTTRVRPWYRKELGMSATLWYVYLPYCFSPKSLNI